jgi:hypothetical protein
MQFVITKSNESVLTAPSRIMSNSLIPISVETPADAHKKVQMGVFFLKDNSDKEKQWMIEGGVFFQNISGTASADFKILSPKEPGLYYLGMPISYLESEFKSLSDSYDILLHEIRVTLDMVNVTGRVVNLSGSGLAEVDVKIGNEDTETNASGYFTIEIPKGKKAVEIESDDGFMTSDKIQFNQNREVNVTFYPITIIGNLSKTFFNITSSTNIETETKLSITPIITNLGSENFTNAKLIGSAPSGQTLKYKNISNGASANSSFTQLYAGFKDSTNDLVLKLKVEPESWNSTGYFMVSGLGSVNSTLGVKIEREYTVETYAQPGDNIDNDNDGQSDEEQNNNQDDDNDGKIDEDLEATQTIEGGYCGDSVCQFDEMDYCFEDCEGGEDIIICGDGFCDSANGEDNFCFEDCGGNQTTCSPWTCEGLGQGQWCNEWGMITGDNFCDFCSWANPGFCGESCNEFNCWACSIDNSSGSNECQNTGCTFGSDQYGSWCYWQSTCSANDCWACGTQGDCSGTGSCAWTPDSWAPNGGWCEMPMDCTSNCAACGDQFSCTNSTATMVDEGNNTIGCTWESDNWGSWCEFNFSHGGFDDNEVKNFWLGLTNTTTDWEAVADYECYSGNCGNGITAGCYYVIVELGDADVNVSVNDTFLGFFAGDNYIQNYPTNSCFDFTNGSWTVSVEDIFEFETTNWTITIGSFDGNPPGPEDVNISVIITAPTNDQTLSVDYIELEYNVSGNLSASAYNHTQLYLNFHQNETNRTDTEGLKYYNFTNLADGNYELVVKLYNETDSILAGESVNVTINTSLPSSFDALVSILNPTNEEVFNENDIYIEYNVSGNTTNYENTTIEIISESFITRVDAVPGIFNYTFANVSDGDHTARVLLTSSMGQTTFDTVNLTINTSGGSGIDGKVNGSGALANVTIEIYNSTNQQLVANLTTDVNGNFNSPLATGTYFADITPPESYAYDVDIAVDNMVISEMETMDIMMPHIDGLPSLNSSPFSEFGLISWPNATAANFSMFVNNSNSYPINVTLILNASLLGDTVEYSNQQSYLTGGQFIELSYLFTPTIMGIGDLEFNLIVELNQSEVMSGSLSSSQLEVDIGMPIPLNIT